MFLTVLYSCTRQISVWEGDKGCQGGVWTSPTKIQRWHDLEKKIQFEIIHIIVLFSVDCCIIVLYCTVVLASVICSQWPPELTPGLASQILQRSDTLSRGGIDYALQYKTGCTVMYCTALYCTLLHCTVLYFTLQYWTTLHCLVRHNIGLHCTVW